MWQELELASELESDLLDNVDWGRKWLVGFNTGKAQLVSFNQSFSTGAIYLKMVDLFFRKKSSFKVLVFLF